MRRQNKCLLPSARESVTGQVINTCKAQLGEPDSFIGVPFRNVGEAEMSQTSCITETHPSMLDPRSSLYNLQVTQRVSCKELIGLCLSQGTQSVSDSLRLLSRGRASSGQQGFPRVSPSPYLLSRKDGLRCIHLDNFRDFLIPSCCLLSELSGDALLKLGSMGIREQGDPQCFPVKGFN